MARDPLVFGFLQTLLCNCMVSLMRNGLVTQMIVPPQVFFLIFLSATWSSTKQRTVTHSSTEAEYRAITTAAAELQWVKSLLSELLALVQLTPTLFSDNFGATYLSVNPVFHYRMKCIAIDYHFVHGLIQSSELRVVHVSVGDQLADARTKPLSQSCLFCLCNKIGITYGTPS